MKLLRIKLPDQLHARLKVQAAMDSTSMQEQAVAAFKLLVERASGPKSSNDPFWCYLCDRPKNDCACKINRALASANPQKRGM